MYKEFLLLPCSRTSLTEIHMNPLDNYLGNLVSHYFANSPTGPRVLETETVSSPPPCPALRCVCVYKEQIFFSSSFIK